MDKAAVFDEYRNLLFSIAYRMLGSVMSAEDMLQEAFLRWQQVDTEYVESPKAYLTTIITRLCLDQLKSAQTQRETYIGPWLPEPLVMRQGPPDAVALAESLSMAFLVMLEQLTPTERAVFLLREVFDYGYSDIAQMIDKSEANCRQIVRRARQRIAGERPRFESTPEQQQRLLNEFLQACMQGNMDGLMTVLADDITSWSDGGGKTAAAINPIYGADRVARYVLGVIPRMPEDFAVRVANVNGQIGLVIYKPDGQPYGALLIDVYQNRIQYMRIVINPDKLGGIPNLSTLDSQQEAER